MLIRELNREETLSCRFVTPSRPREPPAARVRTGRRQRSIGPLPTTVPIPLSRSGLLRGQLRDRPLGGRREADLPEAPLQRVLGTLPPAARPDHNVFTIAHSFNGTYADLEIETNGTIYVLGAASPAVEDLSLVSLEGIMYQPARLV